MPDVYRVVPVKVGTAQIRVQARDLGGPARVAALDALPIADVMDAIEAVGREFVSTLEKITPKSASVEFGVEVGFEAGKLVALIASGSLTANLKVTLEWERETAGKA